MIAKDLLMLATSIIDEFGIEPLNLDTPDKVAEATYRIRKKIESVVPSTTAGRAKYAAQTALKILIHGPRTEKRGGGNRGQGRKKLTSEHVQ